MTELIKCLRSSPWVPPVAWLYLRQVQLTKKEATELCTLAKERGMLFRSDYHVSCSFVICFIKMLVTPRNLLVDEKEPFFKGAVSPFLSVLNERPVIVKENLSNNWQFKRSDKFGFTSQGYSPLHRMQKLPSTRVEKLHNILSTRLQS